MKLHKLIAEEYNKLILENKLETKHNSQLFKGETWKFLMDKIKTYFLPQFNKPLTLANTSDKLFDNVLNYYGKEDTKQFMTDIKKYPNAKIGLKVDKYKATIPLFALEYLIKILE